MDVVNIENLKFSYGNNNMFNDLNLKIEEGEFVGLIGANGSGKTTLLKLILGENKRDGGTIKINGLDIDDAQNYGNIGYVPQMNKKSEIAFPITPEEIVGLNLYSKFKVFNKSKKEDKEKVEKALRSVNLYDKRKYNFNNMSGGEQQRVMIAKALVNNPNFIIMDEPTSGIDENSKSLLFQILVHLNRSHNITILIVTHELEYVRKFLSRIIIMKNGQIREFKE